MCAFACVHVRTRTCGYASVRASLRSCLRVSLRACVRAKARMFNIIIKFLLKIANLNYPVTWLFPLAVRPALCTYELTSSGKSKLITLATCWKSMPRDTPDSLSFFRFDACCNKRHHIFNANVKTVIFWSSYVEFGRLSMHKDEIYFPGTQNKQHFIQINGLLQFYKTLKTTDFKDCHLQHQISLDHDNIVLSSELLHQLYFNRIMGSVWNSTQYTSPFFHPLIWHPYTFNIILKFEWDH